MGTTYKIAHGQNASHCRILALPSFRLFRMKEKYMEFEFAVILDCRNHKNHSLSPCE